MGDSVARANSPSDRELMGKQREKVQATVRGKNWCYSCDASYACDDGSKCRVCGTRLGRYRLPIRDIRRIMPLEDH